MTSGASPRGARAKRLTASRDAASLPADLATSALETLIATLERTRTPPSALEARTVRDRAAALYLSEPLHAARIARALRGACERPQARAEVTARAWAARCDAEASLYAGRLAAARRVYAEATVLHEAAGDDRALGVLLVGRVHVLALLGDHVASRELASRTEAMLRRTGDTAYLAKLLLNRGNAAYHSERYQAAFDDYRAAEAALRASGVQDSTWAMLSLNLAVACTNLSRLDEARDLFARCQEWCARLDLPFLAAQAQFNRSLLEARGGDYRTALLLMESADAVFAAQDATDMRAAAARAQGSLYLTLGLVDEAIECASRAVDGFAGEEMELDAMLARLILARAHADGRQSARARELFEDALRFFRARRIGPRQGEVLLDLAQLHLAAGAPRDACVAAQRAVAVFARAHLPAWEADARRHWADAWLAAGDCARAAAVLEPLGARHALLPLRVRTALWATRGRVALRAGARAAAGRALRRAADLVEAQRALLPSAETRHRALSRYSGVYDDLLAWELAGSAPRVDRVVEVIERARGRGFRDSLAAGRAGLPAGIADERVRLGILTQQLEARELAGGVGAGDPEVQGLRAAVSRLERDLLRALMEAGAHDTHAAAAIAQAHRARAFLRETEAVVLYFVADARIVAVTLRRDEESVIVLPAATPKVRAAVDRVRFLLESLLVNAGAGPVNMPFLRRSAESALAALYRLVLEPLADTLETAHRVLISPHGFLHNVPFECLHDGAEYLDHRWTLGRLPTVDLLAHARGSAPRVRAPLDAVVCGVTGAALPAVAIELAAVAARFDPARRVVDHQVSAAGILSAVHDATVVHVSTHGAFRDDNPLFSRLSTSDGGLFLADLFGRRATPDLVVLSACQSGQMFTRGGDDLEGVAHGFLAMGARELVASRWRVDDAATCALMEAFYASYQGEARGDAAEALRHAAVSVRARWDHPFYWGGFSAYGLA